MSFVHTPAVVGMEVKGGLVRVALGDYIALLANRQYDPLRALIRGVVMPHLRSGCAVVLGSVFVDFIESDVPRLGWEEGEHYFPTRVDLWQKPTLDNASTGAWFFSKMPVNCVELDFEQGFVNDAICLLTAYSGPANLDETLQGLGAGATEEEIAGRFLDHCESVIYVDSDGIGLTMFSKAREQVSE